MSTKTDGWVRHKGPVIRERMGGGGGLQNGQVNVLGKRQNSLAAAPIFSSRLQPTYRQTQYSAGKCCSILGAASCFELRCFSFIPLQDVLAILNGGGGGKTSF